MRSLEQVVDRASSWHAPTYTYAPK